MREPWSAKDEINRNEPLVCCILLTRDRPAMAKRAVESFRSQTYTSRVLLIADSGNPEWYLQMPGSDAENEIHDFHYGPYRNGASIGTLRNLANERIPSAQIIAHWDSDDVSMPNRLSEQGALLQSSGAQLVGYNSMLFWDSRGGGEAWAYRSSNKTRPIGTSFCYWRGVWEQRHFPDLPNKDCPFGEDTVWAQGLGVCAVDGIGTEPKMIAAIHGGNTSTSYQLLGLDRSYKRVPEWDEFCKKRMKL